MAISFDDIITWISFGISLVSVALVISLAYTWNKRLKIINHKVTPTVTPTDAEIEVSAIVSEFTQRLRRLEEGLVDQKVKMEILELRTSRVPREVVVLAPNAYSKAEDNSNSFDNSERPSPEKIGLLSGIRTSSQKDRSGVDEKLGITETEALRLVFEGRGKISAKEIQQRIGRTREHTARMMNGLFHDGLVERDVTSRPFSYSITERGRNVLNG
jgi:hypothetical protein